MMKIPMLQASAEDSANDRSAESNPLTIEEISSEADFANREGEWRDLVERSRGASLYHTWEWLSARLVFYWKHKPLAILMVRRKSQLVAAAPFVVDLKAEQWCPGSLTMPETGIDLVSSEPVSDVLDAVFAHLSRTRRRWRIGMQQCPEGSESAASIPEAANRHGLHVFTRPADPSRIVLVNEDWDAYLASRSKKVRREWRRKQNKLERSGNIEIKSVSTATDRESILDDMLAIETKSWKREKGSSMADGLDTSSFYRELALRSADRGWLRCYVVYLDRKPIAYFYGIVFRNELYGLKTSFDLDFASLSPGIVVVLHALRNAFDERVSLVDFLGYDSRWKAEVANAVREHVHVCVYTSNQLQCRACSLLRGQIKPMLEAKAPGLLEVRKKTSQWVKRQLGR